MPKLIPENISRFETIIRNGYVYVDKTGFIEKYEKLGKLVGAFLRPRRFGKTLFTEILSLYYDFSLREKAGELLQNTYIATHPTPLKSSYAVIQFTFSGLETSRDVNETLSAFRDRIVEGIVSFYSRYPELLPAVIRKNAEEPGSGGTQEEAVELYFSDTDRFPTPNRIIDGFVRRFKARSDFPHPLMVIIDEYDNFTNDLLSGSPESFAELTRKNGEVGTFYGALRHHFDSGTIGRIFITGVLPVTLDTAVSGFVKSALTDEPELNDLAGFTDEEVAQLLQETLDLRQCPFSPEEIRGEMKACFDGYLFAPAGRQTVYNPALCLSYVSALAKNGCRRLPPLTAVSGPDIDYQKLAGFMNLIQDRDRKKLLSRLTENGCAAATVPSSMNFSPGTRLNYHEGVAILHFLGFLSVAPPLDPGVSAYGDPASQRTEQITEFVIPNEYFRMLFARFALGRSGPAVWDSILGSMNADQMARQNDISAVASLLREAAGAFVKTTSSSEGESQVSLAVWCILTMTARGRFTITREYHVRRNGSFVFCDTAAEFAQASGEKIPAGEEHDGEEHGGKEHDGKEHDLTDPAPLPVPSQSHCREVRIDTLRGRADLVALNNGQGPSYIFEFKYWRDRKSREETRSRIRRELCSQAIEQLNFYVTDDNLRTVRDLHRYVVMYTWGEFQIWEVE